MAQSDLGGASGPPDGGEPLERLSTQPARPPAIGGRRIGAGLLAALASLLVLAAIEGALRLLPEPPERLSPAVFLDRQGGLEEIERAILDELRNEAPEALGVNRIYVEDEALFWRLRPGVSVAGKNYLVPRAPRERLPFTVTVNEHGFRGPAPAAKKPPGALRVVAVGNSSTFGWGVNDGETYPARLQELLRGRVAGRRVEVMNAGVPGYSSFQGTRLLAESVLPLAPDCVVLSFGFNDSRRAATTDSAFAAARARPLARAARLAGQLVLYRTLERAIRRAGAGGGGADGRLSPAAADRREVRVPVGEFDARMREMLRMVRAAGARPILLAMVIPPEYRDALARLASEEGAPLLETRPYLLARCREPEVRAAFAAEIERHEAAWRDVPPTTWRHPAYADAMHPSALGHALIAEWLAGAIAGADAAREAGCGGAAPPGATQAASRPAP